MTELALMSPSVDREEAMRRVVALAGGPDAGIAEQVLYPYWHFPVRGQLRWLFGSRELDFDCLVDARNGRAMSAERPVLERLPCIDAQQLPVGCDLADAGIAARRYATHALGRGLRMLANFDVGLGPGELLHRPYWIVRTAATRILVDAVTGELHPLSPSEDAPGP